MRLFSAFGLGMVFVGLGFAAAARAESPNPQVKLETSLGVIVIELDREKAPISTENFLAYTREKFYDGTVFHRVVPNFMIQGGGYDADINERSSGLHPPIKNEWKNGLKNVRGTIAMARTNDPDSATAQFFINVVDNPNLDQPISGGAGYAVFGRVVAGMDVVDKIKDTPTTAHPKYPGGKVVPVEAVVIRTATIVSSEKSASGAKTPPAAAAKEPKKE